MKKHNSHTLARLAAYAKKQRPLILCASALLVAGNYMVSVAPKRAGSVIDFLSSKKEAGYLFDERELVMMLLGIAALYLCGYAAQIAAKYSMLQVSRNVSSTLRTDLQRKLNHLPISTLDAHPAGDIMSRMTNDLVSVESLLETDLTDVISQIFVLLVVIGMMLVVNPTLSVVYLILVPVGFAVMRFITGITKKGFRAQQSTVGQLNGFLGNVIDNHVIIKNYTMEPVLEKQFDEINEEFGRAYIKSKFASGFILPFSIIINNLGYILSAVLGAYLMLQNRVTLGEFMAFLLYGQMLGGPLKSASSSINQAQSGMAALERIFEFLEEAEEPDESALRTLNPAAVVGKIAFKEVSFGYTPERTLFEKVSFETKPGSVVAIVGPSGAGKTTIINLLMRFYEVNAGCIELDGVNTATINRDELRRAFGMVLQDSWVFDGTVAENIAYGKRDATRAEVIAAAKLVCCDSFIEALPQGYDTVISEENSHISFGQKQMLVLARTVLSDPKILILDEATSNMDTRTETLITAAMEKLMAGRSTFVIAHRLFTIRNADTILFMQDGDIREVGSHAELLAKNGLYAAMYRAMSS